MNQSRYLVAFIFGFLCLIFISTNTRGQDLSIDEQWAKEIYDKNKDALIIITNDINYYGEPKRITGSGVICESDGKIITNYHNICNKGDLTIYVNKDKYKNIYVLSYDPNKDLAILKIEGENFPTINMANSNDVIKIGMNVFAFGNPLSLDHSLTKGMVSAIRESGDVLDPKFHQGFDVIQIDAEIDSGSSGGALLDTKGNLIGITTFACGEKGGFNFALPIEYARELIKSIVKEKATPIKNFVPPINGDSDEYYKIIKERYIIHNYSNIEPTPNELEESSKIKDEGDNFFTSGKFKEAEDKYKEAIKLNPKYIDAYNNLGLTYTTYVGRSDVPFPDQRKYLEKAKDCFEKEYIIDPNDKYAKKNFAESNMSLGILYLQRENWSESLYYLNKTLEIDNNRKDSYCARGLVNRKLKHWEQSILDLEAAIKMDSKYADAYYNLALTYYDIGKKTEFLDNLKKASELGSIEAKKLIDRLPK